MRIGRVLRRVWIAMLDWLDGLLTSGYWVELDARDTSVTMSGALWRQLRRHYGRDLQGRKVLTVQVGDEYCFMLVHVEELPQRDTALAEVQRNDKYGTKGWESLTPMVGRILTDYGVDFVKYPIAWLSVRKERKLDGKLTFWRMVKRVVNSD